MSGRNATAIVSALVLANAVAVVQPCAARETVRVFDIPAGPLSASLAQFSELTGLSIGISGTLPRLDVSRVKGRMTPDAALRAILRGTELRARRVGNVYRLERAAPTLAKRASPRVTPTVLPPAPPPQEIIVTAQKRREGLSSVPLSVSIIAPSILAGTSATPSIRDISLSIEGLATTNLGPGRNRQFIRGVADSPFTGQSQSTVAVQIDDARVTFDAPNPELRMVDIERVEILKGPQGPLYGSGALGGIYHIVTRTAELDGSSGWARVSTAAVQHGEIRTGFEAVLNQPLIADQLALRAVAYHDIEPGWIDNSDGRKNSNSTRTAGARLSAVWRPSPDWTIDAGIVWQDIDARDSQYVLTSTQNLSRQSTIAEPTDNDLTMAHATLEGRLNGVRLLSATSIVNQGFSYIVDATDAAANFGLTGAARFQDARVYSVLNQEIRLTPVNDQRWLVGLSYMRAKTAGVSTVESDDAEIQSVESIDRKTTEIAVFGEASQRAFGLIDVTIGGRVFRSVARVFATEPMQQRSLQKIRTLFSPSASLSAPLQGDGILYLRYARAKRPSGLAPSDADSGGEFRSDKVNSFDLGVRNSDGGGAFTYSGSAYYTRWARVQSDYLLPNGLVSTRNAGSAVIIGLEAALDWRIAEGFSIAAGSSVQRARLVNASDGSETGQRRLPVVPEFSARISAKKAVSVAGWHGQVVIQANYIGSTVLSLDQDLDRQTGDYGLLSVNGQLSRGNWTITASLDNVFDTQEDSFAFGNPFSVRDKRQYTPLRPRYLSLAVTKRW